MIEGIGLRQKLSAYDRYWSATFWIYKDATFFIMSRFFYNFLLIDAIDRSKISSDRKRLSSAAKPIPPFIFREHSL